MKEMRVRKASSDWFRPKPARPKGIPRGRWLGDLGVLSDVERSVLDHAQYGSPLVLSLDRPVVSSPENTIRAQLIRFLLLGGDRENGIDPKGVQITGAWIAGELDLHECHCKHPLFLFRCNLEGRLTAVNASIPSVNLGGSCVPSIEARSLRTIGSVFLNAQFRSKGEVNLANATIKGELRCTNGNFRNLDQEGAAKGRSINAENATIGGDVSFNKRFTSQGELKLSGAKLGGQLICTGANISNCDERGIPKGNALLAEGISVTDVFFRTGFISRGEIKLSGAQIRGQLSVTKGEFHNFTPDGEEQKTALSLQNAIIKENLFFKPKKVVGRVSLRDCHTTRLIDEPNSWKNVDYQLDGFRYDQLEDPWTSSAAIKWLEGQAPYENKVFVPQPWEQLSMVYRHMGHHTLAAEISIAKQEARRKAGRIGNRQPRRFDGSRIQSIRMAIDWNWKWVSNRVERSWHWIYGILAGYGYRPQRIVYLMFGIACLSGIAFHLGAQAGYFAPTDPVLSSPDLAPTLAEQCGHALEDKAFWTSCEVMPPEYSIFQPMIYSFDVILPLVDLQQEVDWAPVVEDADGNTLIIGAALRWIMWFEILFGWAASLMLVAILGRLVEKD